MTLGCAQLNPCRRLQRDGLLSDDGIKFAPCQRFATSRVACACRDAPLLRHNITCCLRSEFLWWVHHPMGRAVERRSRRTTHTVPGGGGEKEVNSSKVRYICRCQCLPTTCRTTTVLFQVMSPARRQLALVQATYRRRSSTLAPYTR